MSIRGLVMKKVLITIDTEGHIGNDPVKHLIWGLTDHGNEYGINHIMDICDQFNAKVLFFVDIAEAWDYGKDKISEVIKHIRKRGHDVGVHIHPDHMANKSKKFLWEYNKVEQYEIIKKCTVLFKEVTGESPVAFRAGKYGANMDTLDILNELGYRYDFSQFYSQKWCKLDPKIALVSPQRYINLIEMPVTIFKSFQVGSMKRYDKVDAIMNSSEYKHIMNNISRADNYKIISLFYHSFSMLHWRGNPNSPRLNKKEEKKFINSLKYVHESKLFEFVSLDQLDNFSLDTNTSNDTIENIVSTKGFLRQLWYLFNRAYSIRKTNRKAKILIIGVVICCLFLIISIILYFLLAL